MALRVILICFILTGCFGKFKTGEQLYHSGDYAAAIEEFNKVLFVSITDLKSLHLRARSYEELGDLKKAEADYRKILSLEPEYPYAYTGLAKIAWDKGRFKEAENNLLKAAMFAPEDYDVLLFLSRAMIKNERFKNAVKFLDLAIQLKPEEASPHYYKGIAQAYSGDGLGLIVSLNEYIDLEPDNISAYYNRGFGLMTFGHFDYAIEDFDKVLELAPKHYDALARRAVCMMKNNPRQACFDLETAALNGNEYAKHHQGDCSQFYTFNATLYGQN